MQDTATRKEPTGQATRVRPIGSTVGIHDSTAQALRAMKREGSSFVPVIADDTGKLLGVVMRKAVERGCQGMGHDAETCRVYDHLKTNIRFVFESETPDSELRSAAAAGPVVVVDAGLVPVGILEPGGEP